MRSRDGGGAEAFGGARFFVTWQNVGDTHETYSQNGVAKKAREDVIEIREASSVERLGSDGQAWFLSADMDIEFRYDGV